MTRNCTQFWSYVTFYATGAAKRTLAERNHRVKYPMSYFQGCAIKKLSDMSENLGALRAMPKESIPNIALPITSPWKSPSVSPPRVSKLGGRESPRGPVRFSTIIEEIPNPAHQREDSPISTRTRLQRQSAADKPIASRTRSQLANHATTVTPSNTAGRRYP